MYYKDEFHKFQLLFFPLIINIRILPYFGKKWCTFDMEKGCLKNKHYSQVNFECFKHAKKLLKHHQFELNFDN
jgi:hypothetical protein